MVGYQKVRHLKQENFQDRMDEMKPHLTRLFLEKNHNFQRLPIWTFHLLHNYVITKYDLQETSFYTPIDKIRGWAKYGTTALKPWLLAVGTQIENIILRYIQLKQKGGQPTTQNDVIDIANYLINGSTLVTTMNRFYQSNSKSLTREFGITWYRNFMRRNKNNT